MAGPAHLQAIHRDLSPVVCSSLIIEAHQLQKSSHEKRQEQPLPGLAETCYCGCCCCCCDVRLLLQLLLRLLWRTPVISAAVTAIVANACYLGCCYGYFGVRLLVRLLLRLL